ncbi:hypothetical protein [Nocardia asteroides]|uniref:DUF8020 domain-containing protein n=1 Tax=Nocardia asteroides NBRC 15531 TaxID=1110697 RepID=U5EI30_NOCAS|nr:hypothetical protein [Nocardia asteroides]TLF68849.1 hypothetical protein FEK33_00390 [Nocardia asteroides NBRC 15531]UGT48315.1 hypothetical protein LT345_28210 [Nocardia asteroides]SFL55475.1 hypothetical protein SAMN05444423_10179 [Nocardia asteroides]VEG32522.1 Uncharacterised protein [Nocardia asteroides]GAD84804.1 hypothetical protein NCAST_25_02260 [Nocardia asteroides NBRC 15531]
MKMRKLAVVAALLTLATGVAAGTSVAAPAQETGAPINFSAQEVNGTSVITTDAGSLVVEEGAFKVKAADGTTVAATPLSFRLDDFELPIAADISGNKAVLTPQLDPAKAVYKPVALPFEDKAPFKTEYDREVAAWSRLTSTISTGAAVGTLVGGLAGGAVGCVLGGIVGATVASATIIGLFGPFLPAAAVGCIGGILAIGALGTLAGQIFITAPVAIGAAIQYFTTINAPFTPPAK